MAIVVICLSSMGADQSLPTAKTSSSEGFWPVSKNPSAPNANKAPAAPPVTKAPDHPAPRKAPSTSPGGKAHSPASKEPVHPPSPPAAKKVEVCFCEPKYILMT